MKITKVTVKKEESKENSRLVGYAVVELDDMFVVRDIRIINGEKGLFVAMPSRKGSDGKYKDICHPINQESRAIFTDAILNEFNSVE